MVIEFCGFTGGVISKDLPADSTLNNMKKAELIKLLHTAQHNYESLQWFYNNAVNVNMRHIENNKKIKPKFIRNKSCTTSVWECKCGKIFDTCHKPGVLDGTDVRFCKYCGVEFNWLEEDE